MVNLSGVDKVSQLSLARILHSHLFLMWRLLGGFPCLVHLQLVCWAGAVLGLSVYSQVKLCDLLVKFLLCSAEDPPPPYTLCGVEGSLVPSVLDHRARSKHI